MDMENLRLKRSQERSNKDNGNSCRVFSDKQLNDNSTAIFWHRQFCELELSRSCKTCYTKLWHYMVGLTLTRHRVKQRDFYSAAQPCEATVKNQHRAKTVVDGRDYHVP